MHDDRSSRDDAPQSVKRTVRRGLLAFGAYMLVLAVVMFWPAGGLGWVRGWAFLGTFFVVNVATVVYLWRTNPEIVVARSATHRGTRLWDRVLFFLLNLLVLALFPVAHGQCRASIGQRFRSGSPWSATCCSCFRWPGSYG